MLRKTATVASLLLGSSFIPFLLHAESQSTTAASPTVAPTVQSATITELPKDTWLNSTMPLLPDLICKGFMQDASLKKRFDEIKMTYEQCTALIPESTAKCKNEIYNQIPEKITSENASIWGRKLGECIGKDFAEKHLVPKS